MKQIGFSYQVAAKVELTKDEVDLLCSLGARHYDLACRAAVIPGENAFLNGARNLMGTGNIVVVSWSFRECDIARKILESAQISLDAVAVEKLDAALNAAQDAINTEFERLKK